MFNYELHAKNQEKIFKKFLQTLESKGTELKTDRHARFYRMSSSTKNSEYPLGISDEYTTKNAQCKNHISKNELIHAIESLYTELVDDFFDDDDIDDISVVNIGSLNAGRVPEFSIITDKSNIMPSKFCIYSDIYSLDDIIERVVSDCCAPYEDWVYYGGKLVNLNKLEYDFSLSNDHNDIVYVFSNLDIRISNMADSWPHFDIKINEVKNFILSHGLNSRNVGNIQTVLSKEKIRNSGLYAKAYASDDFIDALSEAYDEIPDEVKLKYELYKNN